MPVSGRAVSISDHFKDDVEVVCEPSTGLVVGVLENAVAYQGHPLCHFVTVDEDTAEIIRDDIERGVFDVYREGGFQWLELRWYTHHEHETDSTPAGNAHDTERENRHDLSFPSDISTTVRSGDETGRANRSP